MKKIKTKISLFLPRICDSLNLQSSSSIADQKSLYKHSLWQFVKQHLFNTMAKALFWNEKSNPPS